MKSPYSFVILGNLSVDVTTSSTTTTTAAASTSSNINGDLYYEIGEHGIVTSTTTTTTTTAASTASDINDGLFYEIDENDIKLLPDEEISYEESEIEEAAENPCSFKDSDCFYQYYEYLNDEGNE